MRLILIILIAFCLLGACKDRYGLPMERSLSNSLVVEGNILKGDSTFIRLSRVTSVGDLNLLPETGATVIVEGADNTTTTLSETEPGLYKVAPIDLNSSVNYRLRILSGSKEYESDWTSLINTADIESVFWERNDGIDILVKSSGNADNSRYYKWDYEEVWDFYSKYKSYAYFTYVGLDERLQPIIQCIDKEENGEQFNTCIDVYGPFGSVYNDSMYHCWKYQQSRSITIGSTAALNDNVMQSVVRKIENNGFELNSLYSILVKQTGLSKESYEFYKILKGNSEGVGTIFDAQPSQLKTNLHCVTDPGERVIGFIDATSVKTKRLFISNSEVGDWNYDPYMGCVNGNCNNGPEAVEEAVNFGQVPVEVLEFEDDPAFRVTQVSTSSSLCVDCRLRGVHRKPEFWP
jgi:hypothetical protein